MAVYSLGRKYIGSTTSNTVHNCILDTPYVPYFTLGLEGWIYIIKEKIKGGWGTLVYHRYIT